jgi:MFS family permease
VNHLDYAEEEKTFRLQVQRNLRWNSAANLLDGAFFWFGINFAAAGTILPLYVRNLTESNLLIGLVATIASAGWYLPQLLTANYIERLPRKKPVVIQVGFFTERLGFVLMAASAYIFAPRSPSMALVTFFVALTWFNVGAGVVAVAWQEMFAKVIPVEMRGRVFGLASFVGTATGILGANLAASILDRYPFPGNFGLCFTLAFVFMVLSWASLALTREPALSPRKPAISLAQYGQLLPDILRRDRNFAWYLVARVMTVLGRMGFGFLAVYAAARWSLTDSQAGRYTTALVIGQAAANLVFGALADRRGHKVVLEISLVLAGLAMIGALLAPSSKSMYVVFAIVGAVYGADVLSMIGIVMEFTDPKDRPTYIGLANSTPGLFAAIAPVIGGWIASRASYSLTFAGGALLSVMAWAVLHRLVTEPRISKSSGER